VVAARLAKVDAALDNLGDLTEVQRAVRRAGLLAERARLTGRDADLFAAEDVAEDMVERGVWHDDLLHTLVLLSVDSHDVARAADLLALSPRLAQSPRGVLVASSIARQRGMLVDAATALLGVLRTDPTWEHLAALAAVFADLGDVPSADALYACAEDEIDALQMWSFAGVELHRARMWRQRGEHDRAGDHLRRAQAAWGDWRVAEERGRQLLQQGLAGDAARLFEQLVAATDRPDHWHALGCALDAAGELDAQRAYEHARRGYESCRVASRYRHHLAEYHLRVSGDVLAALRLAREDAAARPNPATRRLLAAVLEAIGDRSARDEVLASTEADRLAQLRAARTLLGRISRRGG
jgi:tetratricopeptide (TPR) repeat protein